VTALRFIFGLHVHQPVGNFDHVFEEHAREVYLPLLTRLAERECLPLVLHISGPLLEWLDAHGDRYLDLVGRLVADGQVELLMSGVYEPVLASLPRSDRVEQIQWMRDAIRARFGVDPTGLWLTERVWEPELASDLAAAGVRYSLVDDRHFLITGFRPEQLHTYYMTESSGDYVALFPIHERLRYLVPFRPVAELELYLQELHRAGRALAVLADDGEKFGGWPGTRAWVYEHGWLEQFLHVIERLRHDGVIELTTCQAALRAVPSGGIAYLPTASYREMEGWALPADAGRRLAELERDLGEERLAGPAGSFVRGGHWRNFLVKYPEANRAHKMMLALSTLARERGDPPDARRAIARAQCNDAYWHGVFGGLYLPHLRGAIWQQLAVAEGSLRREESLAVEVLDFDGDGEPEVWVHSSRFSAVIAPHRGAGVEVYTLFADEVNYADTLTRRIEAYHEPVAKRVNDESAAASGVAAGGVAAGGVAAGEGAAGAPSIHDLERGRVATGALPIDAESRALFLERVLPAAMQQSAYESGRYEPVLRWSDAQFTFAVERSGAVAEIVCVAKGLEKRFRFDSHGRITVTYRWAGGAQPRDRFATELSLAHACTIAASPAAERWTYPIETVAQSERGIERTRQGDSVTILWDIGAAGDAFRQGRVTITLQPGTSALSATSGH